MAITETTVSEELRLEDFDEADNLIHLVSHADDKKAYCGAEVTRLRIGESADCIVCLEIKKARLKGLM